METKGASKSVQGNMLGRNFDEDFQRQLQSQNTDIGNGPIRFSTIKLQIDEEPNDKEKTPATKSDFKSD